MSGEQLSEPVFPTYRGPQVVPRPPGAVLGPPGPWLRLPPERRRGFTLARVRGVLASGPAADTHPLELDHGRLRPSAVLVPLFEEDGEARVVLTRRSGALRSHTGQVSFPGGRIDPGETAQHAALREAYEEVGIDPASVEVVGPLPPLATFAGGSAIQPFVGFLSHRPHLVPNPAEVERAFDLALADLLIDGVHTAETWTAPGAGERDIHFFDFPEDLVWGATARILYALLESLL